MLTDTIVDSQIEKKGLTARRVFIRRRDVQFGTKSGISASPRKHLHKKISEIPGRFLLLSAFAVNVEIFASQETTPDFKLEKRAPAW
jgi:hypothetical protein